MRTDTVPRGLGWTDSNNVAYRLGSCAPGAVVVRKSCVLEVCGDCGHVLCGLEREETVMQFNNDNNKRNMNDRYVLSYASHSETQF